jgi:hypothetical protein
MTNSKQHRSEVLQDRFGVRLVGRLSYANADIPYDIAERLRAARVQAVARRKLTQFQTAASVHVNGGAATLGFGDEGLGVWGRIASLMPLIALVVGLVAITMSQNDSRAREVAEVDAALLTDDLPPNAYADPGFMQFLKSSQDGIR